MMLWTPYCRVGTTYIDSKTLIPLQFLQTEKLRKILTLTIARRLRKMKIMSSSSFFFLTLTVPTLRFKVTMVMFPLLCTIIFYINV